MIRILIVAVAAGILPGCATQHKPLYAWEGYQKNVATYLRSENGANLGELTQSMEQDLQKINAEHGVVPPGYHAHLGLLYIQQGRLDQFGQHVEAEKAQYPESATFMDFLTRNFKK